MASIYNDVVSSRRGSRALPWCHSRFVLCSSPDWIAALRMPRLPCWDRSGHVCCAKRDELGRGAGLAFLHRQLLHPVRGYQLGHNGTRGQSKRAGTRPTERDVGCQPAPRGGMWGKRREERGCKALAQAKGGCRQGREIWGQTGAGKAPGARNQVAI